MEGGLGPCVCVRECGHKMRMYSPRMGVRGGAVPLPSLQGGGLGAECTKPHSSCPPAASPAPGPGAAPTLSGQMGGRLGGHLQASLDGPSLCAQACITLCPALGGAWGRGKTTKDLSHYRMPRLKGTSAALHCVSTTALCSPVNLCRATKAELL